MFGLRCGLVSGLACAGVLAFAGGASGATPVLTGHSGWFWGDPLPQGKTLNAVVFDGESGYAAGAFGTALHSVDGGQTWTGLATGSVEDLTAVTQLDPNTAVVSGGCTVAETIDAGTSFTDFPNIGGASCGGGVVATAFSTPASGYIAEANGDVLFTDDSGVTLAARTPVPVTGGAQVTDLVFPTSGEGFASTTTGQIERTVDGGNSWTQVAGAAAGLNAITFVTPALAYAVGNDNVLLRSDDAGQSWQPLPLTATGTAGDSLTHITCSDPNDCLITIAGLEGGLLRTTDGGQTASLVTPSDQSITDVALTSGTGVVGVGVSGAIVLSPDGGATFPQTVSSALTVGASPDALNLLRPGATADDAYLLGGSGQLASTADGGQTWSTIRIPGGADVVDAAFPTASTGYVIGADHVLRATTDGGESWRVLDATVGRLSQIGALGSADVVLAGPAGLQRSTDGGTSFSPVNSTVTLRPQTKPAEVQSLSLDRVQVQGSTIIAWGPTEAVESTDGGAHWQGVDLPRRTKVTQLDFVSPTVGWITDRAGELLTTHNRGRTWQTVPNLGFSSPGSISFSSPRDGFVTPSPQSGATPFDLLATTDGGSTWRPELVDGARLSEDAPSDLQEAVLATSGHGYLVDPDGLGSDQQADALFATTNGGASAQTARLTLAASARSTKRAALRRAHGRVTVSGRLTPSPGPDGATLTLSDRRPGATWTTHQVIVGSNGAYKTTLAGIRATTDVVADVVSNGARDGAAAYQRIVVTH